ncbi:MAG: hypothetical protein PHC70_02745 [Patescibacteria group bacterium]|nr:hypothetical protein [Patescibacteria group bacterium]
MNAFFHQNFVSAAKSAVGKKIRIGGLEAEILEAKGYSRSDNDTPLYSPIISMQPGGVYLPRYRGGILFLIACRDGMDAGGCILVKKISINGDVFNGPGRVSEALGCTTHGQSGRLTESKGTFVLKL